MFKNVKIRLKFLILIIPPMLGFLGMTIYAGVTEAATLREAKAVYYDDLKHMIELLITVDRDFYQAQIASDHSHILRLKGDQENMQSAFDDFKENRQQVYDGLSSVQAEFAEDAYLNSEFRIDGQTAPVSQIVEETVKDIKSWEGVYDPINNFGSYDGQFPAFLEARNGINQLEEVVESYSEYVNDKLQKEVRVKIIITLVLVAAVLLVIGILAVNIISYFVGSIRLISDRIEKLSNGEFEKVDKYLDYNDGLGKALKNTNTLMDKLGEIVGNIRNMANQIGASSKELAGTSNQIAQTADGVSTAVVEIATGATQQADEIQHATESVGNIGEALGHVNASTENLNNINSRMTDNSRNSSAQLGKLEKSSEEMSAAIVDISERISATSKAVENINSKVDMINNIASQTNLLALNASIEAARAGEAGKGFAVVAEEIGTLANDSSVTADEIREQMNVLLKESQSAVEKSAQVSETNNAQKEILHSTVESIDKLMRDIEESSIGAKEISENANTCDSAKNVVVDAMGSLSAISEENAASSQETSASMQELNATVTTLAESANELSDIAHNLNEELSFFK